MRYLGSIVGLMLMAFCARAETPVGTTIMAVGTIGKHTYSVQRVSLPGSRTLAIASYVDTANPANAFISSQFTIVTSASLTGARTAICAGTTVYRGRRATWVYVLTDDDAAGDHVKLTITAGTTVLLNVDGKPDQGKFGVAILP